MTRAELLELLKKARKQLKKYHVPKDEQTVTLSIDTLEAALSEQPTIVRCKNCKKKGDAYLCRLDSDLLEHGGHRTDEYDNWFCADGERRIDDA